MLKADKNSQLHLWKPFGFFKMLDCFIDGDLDVYSEQRGSFVGVTSSNLQIDRGNDRTGCYILFFRKNSRFYIGSGKRLSARSSVHLAMLKSDSHYNEKITKAFEDNGSRMPEVIFIYCFDHEHAKDVEQRLIDLVFDDPYCLNQQQMVNEYRPTTEETRGKKKSSALIQWRNPDFLERIERVYKDPEVIARKKAAAQEVSKRPEYRKKISEASKEMWKDPEYAANQKVSGGKIWKDEEFCARHATAMKDKWADPEYKARVGRGMQAANVAKRKSVVVDGTHYRTAVEAAKALGIGENTVRRRCMSDRAGFEAWVFV